MRDPHVNWIKYKVDTSENIIYENCLPVKHSTREYDLILDNGIVTCEFKEHYDNIHSARSTVEALLRSWAIDSALEHGNKNLRFSFLDTEVIDRDPPSPSFVMNVGAARSFGKALPPKVLVSSSHYPEPPQHFTATPDVETLWLRYEMYLEGRDQLLSMSYFCLSFLEQLAGARSLIPAQYCIERDVLDTLGNLTSARGDRTTARKGKGHSFMPLSQSEINWIEQCIKIIIRRVGEYSFNPSSLKNITMVDLPRL